MLLRAGADARLHTPPSPSEGSFYHHCTGPARSSASARNHRTPMSAGASQNVEPALGARAVRLREHASTQRGRSLGNRRSERCTMRCKRATVSPASASPPERIPCAGASAERRKRRASPKAPPPRSADLPNGGGRRRGDGARTVPTTAVHLSLPAFPAKATSAHTAPHRAPGPKVPPNHGAPAGADALLHTLPHLPASQRR